jgi:hypothetical protein
MVQDPGQADLRTMAPRRDAEMSVRDGCRWMSEELPEQGFPSVGSALPRPPDSTVRSGGTNGCEASQQKLTLSTIYFYP